MARVAPATDVVPSGNTSDKNASEGDAEFVGMKKPSEKSANVAGCIPMPVINYMGDPASGKLPQVEVKGKVKRLCRRSLYIFPLDGCFRIHVLAFVEWKWFDNFILFLILINSLALACYQYRQSETEGFNFFCNQVLDPILTAFFTVELLLKVIAWGFIMDKGSYLRDAWNWLDFVVVVTALVAYIPGNSGDLSFFRLFRILRPLRSLNSVPQLKVLVNTVISSVPRLANVSIMMFFCFWIFAIIGITVLDGIFYRGCRATANPILETTGNISCWKWEYTDDDRLCGGRYDCKTPSSDAIAVGFCGGHEADSNKALRPNFPGGKQGFDWCEASEPKKIMPETDFVHFDHIGGALLTVFQSMTMEGWTDIMYYVQDGFGFWLATIYFFLLVVITSFGLLNVALAVVDEARADFDKEEEEEEGAEEEESDFDDDPLVDSDAPPWCDCLLVRILRKIALNEIFVNTIMLFIAGNVVVMMLEQFPPQVSWQDFLGVLETLFLVVFCIEMVIMIGACGPKAYVCNPVTCFDGFIVIISVIEAAVGGGGSAFTAFRTLRLFRVMNKLANRWPAFGMLMKAMVKTAISLKYWLVLFGLLVFILALMFISFFNRKFHFADMDGYRTVADSQGDPWCADSEGESDVAYRQDCIPRAHFDTFLWSVVTVFQIMTGENWNWIMYAGMRANGWAFCIIFILVIVFGQTIILSLFLSMLMDTFAKVQERLDAEREKEKEKNQKKALIRSNSSVAQAKLGTPTAAGDSDDSSPATVPSPAVDSIASTASEMAKEGTAVQDPPIAATAPGDDQLAPKRGDQDPSQDGHPAMDGKSAPDVIAASSSAPPDKQDDDQTKTAVVKSGTDSFEKWPFLQRCVGRGEDKWPRDYAWFILHTGNPLRRACWWLMEYKFKGWNIFDNFILLCILASTLCMACDTPLNDPAATGTKIIRTADTVFAIIFICEMAVKLVAMGLILHKGSYLRSGWNQLDGIVVAVSVIGLITGPGGGGFLKTLRILRALRPLRVISRNPNLKVVVQTIFASAPPLMTLVIVCAVFLLIFALFGLSYLAGTFYDCTVPELPDGSESPMFLTRKFDSSIPSTPLCLDPTGTVSSSACPRGQFDEASGLWPNASLACAGNAAAAPFGCSTTPTQTLAWQRMTADTPICVGRCVEGQTPTGLCPRAFESAEELPHNCLDSVAKKRVLTPQLQASEAIGTAYVNAMKRAIVMPCAGTTVDASGVLTRPAAAGSCRAIFCGANIDGDKMKSCENNCKKHPFFCTKTCKDDANSANCKSCIEECTEACACEDHCEPLVKDAALCAEQGGSWALTIPQNFNNVWMALLVLFEISSTEAWVDVMYAACDSTAPYEAPQRDNNQWLFGPFFVVYIFMSFMFLLNLSVGVIVDQFMELKEKFKGENKEVMMTPLQASWLKSRRTLMNKVTLFRLTNLHTLSKSRRFMYKLVESQLFDIGMIIAIVLNTFVMAAKIFPTPTDWWEDMCWGLDILFTVIFLVEFLMKKYALHWAYWSDNWNRFDFMCLVTAILGTILTVATPNFAVGQTITQIFRIFRVARLFRLLRSKRLNKIFMALVLSLPKLGNVLGILLLLLTLYSILGVSLFATAHPLEFLNTHGNFQHFGWAFITLFRAVTGEAWNSIMHDLLMTSEDWFRSDDWCTPDGLFDTATEEKFNILNSKCLIQRPNACVQTIWGRNWFPAIYWVSYILLICLMVMNLVIAVILEGYDDGQQKPEEAVIDLCVRTWRTYDSNHTMTLPLPEGLKFINEVVCRWYGDDLETKRYVSAFGNDVMAFHVKADFDLGKMPMKCARQFDLSVSEDGKIDFLDASRQALRFTLSGREENAIKNLTAVEDAMSDKDKELMAKIEAKSKKKLKLVSVETKDLRRTVAAVKLQRCARRSLNSKKDINWKVQDVPSSGEEASGPGKTRN